MRMEYNKYKEEKCKERKKGGTYILVVLIVTVVNSYVVQKPFVGVRKYCQVSTQESRESSIYN